MSIWSIFMIFAAFSLVGEEFSVRIAVSKSSDVFVDWFSKADSSVKIVDLSLLSKDESLTALKECSGLVLSGGPDVNPSYYGQAEKAYLCEIDSERDVREWALTKQAIDLKMPILAICRGFQLVNVFLGGTLIVDIPTETTSKVIHRIEKGFSYHLVFVEKGTLLDSLMPSDFAVVNSRHHQAIGRLASPLLVSAWSEDGIIEAVEWKEKKGKAFLLGIEWHPERMTDAFSKRIAKAFIAAVRENSFHLVE